MAEISVFKIGCQSHLGVFDKELVLKVSRYLEKAKTWHDCNYEQQRQAHSE